MAPRHAATLSACALAAFTLGLLIYVCRVDAAPLVLRAGLPSLLHTYTFVLLGCAWFARSRRQALVIGLGLWAVDGALETLQLPALHAALGLSGWPGALLSGTFDPLDLLASTAGLLAAWGTWAAVRR